MKIHLNPLAISIIVDKLPNNFGGISYGPFIGIIKKYENDEGLMQHELTHASQFWKVGILFSSFVLFILSCLHFPVDYLWYSLLGFFLHGFAYLLFDKYKLFCEVKAYKEQLKYYDTDKTDLFVEFISTKYGLSVDKEEIKKLLKE